MLSLLTQGEVCVGDLVAVLRLPQPTVSRHLAYLRRSGLVAVRRDSSRMYYTLVDPRRPFHAKLLECLTSCFSEVPELTRDATRARKKMSWC